MNASLSPSISVYERLATIGLLFYAVFLPGLLLWRLLIATQGHFSYVLDDPYIHLSLSEELARGHYGLNPFENASPSSSLLFPWLLAPFSKTSFHVYLPFLLCWGATCLTLYSWIRIAGAAGLWQSPRMALLMALGTLLATTFFNLYGVIFTGMEHSLHIVCCFGLWWCLIGVADGRVRPLWTVFFLVCLPLLRPEGIAMTGGAFLVLLFYHQRRLVYAAFFLLCVLMGLYAAHLQAQGLPVIPSSIASKWHFNFLLPGGEKSPSSIASGASFLQEGSEPSRNGQIFLLALLFLQLIGCVRDWRKKPHYRPLALWGISILLAHFVAGAWGWMARYEIYVILFGLAFTVWQWSDNIKSFLSACSFSRWLMVTLSAFLVLLWGGGAYYAQATLWVPTAANNIYEMHGQMQRFATRFYPYPIAVNDVGLISYRNDHYILDLWGLGSEKARIARLRSPKNDVQWMEVLAQEHQVTLAILFDHWFPVIPSNWQAVAKLYLSDKPVIIPQQYVTFYATTREAVPKISVAMRRFSSTLPPGMRIEWLPAYARD
jgi:hypothetical protein